VKSQAAEIEKGGPMITRETLSELMSFNPEEYLTTTLYLQIDGSSPSYAIELKELVKQRKAELKQQRLPAPLQRSLSSDFRKVTEYITLKFSKERVKTVVIFSCSAKKFWKEVTLQLPLRSQLAVAPRFNLRPLTLVLDNYSRFLIILLDRAKARLFEAYAGEIAEYTNISDEVPSQVRMGGFSGYEEKRIQRHIEDHVRRHFKHVSDKAFDLFKKFSHDHVILSGTEQNTSEFRSYLPSTMADRLAGEFHAEIYAPIKEISDHTNRLEAERAKAAIAATLQSSELRRISHRWSRAHCACATAGPSQLFDRAGRVWTAGLSMYRLLEFVDL
jgi:peptide chain release factor subunit 1